MRSVAVVDGVLLPIERASVPVSDRGFLYGDAIFEILRTYGGALPFAAAHVARARCAIAAFGLPEDEHTSEAALLHALASAVRGADLAAGEDAVLRLIVTRGDGPGIDVPAEAVARVIVTAAPYAPSASLARGLVAVTAAREGAGVVAGWKTGSYLGNVLARRAARAKGADEAVFVEGDALLECAGANLFAVVGEGRDTLLTAPDAAGVLPGITRHHVAVAAESMGLRVMWEAPRLGRLGLVHELFATSSVRGIVPVRELLAPGGERLFAQTDWPVTTRISDAFQGLAWSLASA